MARTSYGVGPYSRIRSLAPVFSGDITVVPAISLTGGLTPAIVFAADLDIHVSLVMLRGDLAPQIALAGSLSLDVTLDSLTGSFAVTPVYGAAEMISGPLWANSEPCPAEPWASAETCPPSMWTPTIPPSWIVTDDLSGGYGLGAYGAGAYTEFASPWVPIEMCNG